MDFESMLTTPLVYQDVPSGFMMNPIMPMYGSGIYPYYGLAPMKPVLNKDKFEKLREKQNEAKHTVRNTLIIGGLTTLALVILGKKFKAPSIKFSNIKNFLTRVKTTGADFCSNLKQKFLNNLNKFKK